MDFEQFRVRTQEYAWLYDTETHAEAERKQAFHAAVSIALDEYALEDVDIANEIALDVAGDGGIDFFFVSDEENPPRIFCIQVKHHAVFGKADQVAALVKMKTTVDLLRGKVNGNGLSDLDNQRRMDIRRLRNSSIVDYKLLLTAGAKSSVSASDLPDEWHVEQIDWSVEDLEGLTALMNRDSDRKEPEVTLVFPKSQTLLIDGETRVFHGYVNALDYARATHMHKKSAEILQMNPRLFLSSKSGFNAGMLHTLSSSDESRHFHLYNNGITAVAKRVVSTERYDDHVLTCSDFQIVNGGQTTETIWKWFEDIQLMNHSELGDVETISEVLVPIRIVETLDSELAAHISQFNNSQNAITSADLVANSKVQRSIKNWIEHIAVKPYIYEARRGTWRKLSPAKQQAFKVTDWGNASGSFYRTVDLKVMAQAILAVSGKPEQAKEQINSWFKTDEKHSELFGQISGGYQAALIADLYLFASRPKLWATQDVLDEPDNKSLLSLSRFYITHLVYEHWKTGGRLGSWDDPMLISDPDSQAIRDQVFLSAPDIARKAFMAVKSTKQNQLDAADGIRGLTRKSIYKTPIRTWFEGFVKV